MQTPYFATGYLRVLYRYMRSEGISEKNLFRNTGFSESELMSTTADLPFDDQMRFCINAVSLSQPGLGLRAGSQLQLAAHGPLGIAMQTSENLGVALQTFSQYLDARASFYSTSIQRRGNKTEFLIKTEHLPQSLIHFFTETILHSLIHCVTFFAGGLNQDRSRIKLGYVAPTYGEDYYSVFGSVVEFDAQRTSLQIPSNLLSIPSPEADPVAYSDSMHRCLRQLSEIQEGNLLLDIETFLATNPGKLWSVEEIAALFSISSRTLIRRLKASGTTYQKIRDRVLQQQAQNYLAGMSVEATAMTLGFSDSSSFRRTYKRWYGIAPRQKCH